MTTSPNNSEPIQEERCERCQHLYPLLAKHWGTTYLGICKPCQRAVANESRRDAKLYRSIVVNKAGGKCYVCGFYCPSILVIHHIRPAAQGGDGTDDNLAALCPNCHAIVHSVPAGDEKALYGMSLWVETYMDAEQMDRLNDLIVKAKYNYHLSDYYARRNKGAKTL
jgi:hypothetical protein